MRWSGRADRTRRASGVCRAGATDVAGENHTPLGSADVGPDGTIPTYDYNFQSNYGVVNGSPVKNLITAVEEQRVREIFSLFTQYFGVQFVESASQGITVAVGDLRAIDPTTPTGPGSAAGMAGRPTGGLAIVSNFYNWGNDAFGGSFMQVAMHEIMHTLGFGHSFDLTAAEIMGSSSPGSGPATRGTANRRTAPSAATPPSPTTATSSPASTSIRNDSMDIDLYQFQVD